MAESLRQALAWVLVVLGLCSAAIPAFGLVDWDRERRSRDQPRAAEWTSGLVARFISGWPGIPKLEAAKLMEKYGVPDEVSASRLAWNGRGRWSRIVLNRSEDFTRRSGVLEQSVRYETPVGRWRDLNALAFGVAYSHEDDMLTASSESEAVNILALNVAVDVIKGARTVDEAREFYRKTLDLALSGKSSRYTRGLLFSTGREKIRRRPPWLQPLMP